MPLSLLPSLLSLCLIIGYTPGPANLLSLSSALKYGRQQAFKLWRGLFCGFLIVDVVMAVVTWSLGPIMRDYIPWITYVGAAYIFYLAFRSVINSGKEHTGTGDCSFLTGFVMQLTNAKMIVFCLTSFSLYVLPFSDSLLSYIPVIIIVILAGPIANLVWLLVGAKLQNLFVKHQLGVDLFMALALAFCAFLLIVRSPLPQSVLQELSDLYGSLMF